MKGNAVVEEGRLGMMGGMGCSISKIAALKSELSFHTT